MKLFIIYSDEESTYNNVFNNTAAFELHQLAERRSHILAISIPFSYVGHVWNYINVFMML